MLKLKTTGLFVVLAVLAGSAIQAAYTIFKEPPLKGYYIQPTGPDLKYFTWQRWFSQDFQRVFMAGMNEHAGFRNTLVRINNQFDYSFFGITHAQGFLEGRDRWFYEEDYIHEYTGKYFVGERVIDKTLSRLKNVQDSLASYHIPLIVVFESGKASLYPEHIPARFHPEKRTLSNYSYFLKQSAALGLAYLDITPFLQQVKDTATFPLFPRYGMHWSQYGTHLVADTLSRYIAAATGKPMPQFGTRHIRLSDRSPGADYDIGDLLNLFCPLKPTPGAYPVVFFSAIPDGNTPALIIGDSYYILLVETYGKKMFGKQDYWYYNNSLYPHQNEVPPVRVDKSNLKEKLIQYQVVMLMVSEINLHNCLWNFADEAFLAFHPEVKDSQLDKIENSIRIDREWFRFMVRKSQEQGVPVDQVIRGDAEYTFLSGYQDLAGKNYRDSIEFLRLSIKNNPDWLANVTRKAREMNIPVDSMMMLDAIYSYGQSKKNH